jgi:membrane fusion protein, multidrug efflux system
LVRPVTVSQEDDSNAVLVTGAAAGERVVTTGFAQLKDGTRIAIGTPENLERPAGSERRRRGPITNAPIAQADQKPAAPAPAAQAQEKPPGVDTAGAEKPSSSPSATTTGEPKRAETPAATTGETPRAGLQRRSETRSPTASP